MNFCFIAKGEIMSLVAVAGLVKKACVEHRRNEAGKFIFPIWVGNRSNYCLSIG